MYCCFLGKKRYMTRYKWPDFPTYIFNISNNKFWEKYLFVFLLASLFLYKCLYNLNPAQYSNIHISFQDKLSYLYAAGMFHE